MALANNPNITEKALKDLHAELLQWAVFCADFDHDTARDLLQQSYLKVVDGRAQYEKKSTLKTWLFSVIRLTAFESRRKQPHKLIHCEIDGIDELGELKAEEAEVFLGELYSEKVVESAIKELSLPQREIIYLAFYKDLSLSEIAEVLSVSIGTIRAQYHRAKVRLKVLLTEAENDNHSPGSGARRYEEQYS